MGAIEEHSSKPTTYYVQEKIALINRILAIKVATFFRYKAFHYHKINNLDESVLRGVKSKFEDNRIKKAKKNA